MFSLLAVSGVARWPFRERRPPARPPGRQHVNEGISSCAWSQGGGSPVKAGSNARGRRGRGTRDTVGVAGFVPTFPARSHPIEQRSTNETLNGDQKCWPGRQELGGERCRSRIPGLHQRVSAGRMWARVGRRMLLRMIRQKLRLSALNNHVAVVQRNCHHWSRCTADQHGGKQEIQQQRTKHDHRSRPGNGCHVVEKPAGMLDYSAVQGVGQQSLGLISVCSDAGSPSFPRTGSASCSRDIRLRFPSRGHCQNCSHSSGSRPSICRPARSRRCGRSASHW
jgi:hypothetical protein